MVWASILIPVYNGVEYLEECIDSVISQTFTDWEVLIGINGHGSDGGEVAQMAHMISLKDKRIKVHVQGPPLKGKVESLNDLVSRAVADWIGILDCDDKWKPTKLERQYDAQQNDAHDADVIGTCCEYFGDRDTQLYLPIGYIDPRVLLDYNPIINSSSLTKKKWCHWTYTEYNYGVEDYDFWMKICLSGGKLYNISEFLTYHRIHITSAFNSKGYSDHAIRELYAKRIV